MPFPLSIYSIKSALHLVAVGQSNIASSKIIVWCLSVRRLKCLNATL